MQRLLFVCSIICLFVVAVPVDADNISYIIFNQLAQKYDLKYERDTLTGREIFSGNGYQIIASSGMSTILVNNKLTILEETLKPINGQLAISKKDFSKIDAILRETYTERRITKAKGLLKKVVIDPGHGGDFRGCKSKDGLLEKNINLDIAKRLRNLLEENGVQVVLTRTTDRSLSSNLNEDLLRRAEIANREQPDLFISVHCNWSNDSSVRGFEIYYSPEKNGFPSLNNRAIGAESPSDKQTQKALSHVLRDEYTKKTLEISQMIKKQFRELPTDDRGLRKANFKVLKNTEVPAILVEVDFLSNKKSSQNLAKDSYRQEIAEKIKQTVLSYYLNPSY
jgi:N-acetylmuramoyl-L-alanine amidase